MKLGTVAYNNKIYNLDYMEAADIKELQKKIETEKKNAICQAKDSLNKTK